MQRLEVDLAFQDAVHVADRRVPAFVGERANRLGEHRAADVVDDEVGALAAGGFHHRVGEVSRARADADVQAHAFELVELVLRARRADHLGAERLGGLQSGDADPGGDAGDEQPFARLELPLSDEHVVHHHEDERNARGFLPGEILRHRQSLARIDERVLGEAAAAAPHHAIARLESGHAFSELRDLARAFSAGRFRGTARLDRVPDDQLAAIEARGVHAQQDLPRAGLGHGRVAQL